LMKWRVSSRPLNAKQEHYLAFAQTHPSANLRL